MSGLSSAEGAYRSPVPSTPEGFDTPAARATQPAFARDDAEILDHEYFMGLALAEARKGAAMGEQPFGAVAVLGGEVLASTPSLKVSRCDATAHSETLCAGLATVAAGRRHLPDATFYATCEPCPMCLGAVFAAGFGRLVVGARNSDIIIPGRPAFSYGTFSIETFVPMVGWDLDLISGVRAAECIELYTSATVELTR